jgi:hypothetical protein
MAEPFAPIPVPVGEAVTRNMNDLAASKVSEAIAGFTLSNALFTFIESKLLADLEKDGAIEAATSAARHGYVHMQVVGLLRYLTTQDLLREGPHERFRLSPLGEAALSKGAWGMRQM